MNQDARPTRSGRKARSTTTGGRRPGRPVGTVALTNEMAQTILNYIRAGAFAYVAAEAAGISARTFHDWIARGEGSQPRRPPTARLREFALAVRKAQAEARMGAEVRVHREQPTYWLSRVARTKPDREGWSDPGPGSESGDGSTFDPKNLHTMTDEELDDAGDRLARIMVEDGSYRSPPCSHPRCRCPHHRPREGRSRG